MCVINVLHDILGRGLEVLIKILIVGSFIVGGAAGGQKQHGRIQQQQPERPADLIYFHAAILTDSGRLAMG
jgi:hypothetical protein